MSEINTPNLGLGILDGVKAWRIWVTLGNQDILQRFRNSILGPIWMVANLGVLVFASGYLYSELLKQDPTSLIPFITVSLVIMSFIWPTLTEAAHSFASAGSIIHQVRMPLSVLVLRTIYRNIVVSAYNLLVIVVVFTLYKTWPLIKPLEALLGLALLIGNLSWVVTLVAIAGARFGDMIQLITSALNFISILTPIYWKPSLISKYQIVLDVNPFYHLFQVFREPLLGETPSILNYAITGGGMVVGWVITAIVFNITYKKIVFWV